jgi:hypothetical protein
MTAKTETAHPPSCAINSSPVSLWWAAPARMSGGQHAHFDRVVIRDRAGMLAAALGDQAKVRAILPHAFVAKRARRFGEIAPGGTSGGRVTPSCGAAP